jgi:dihydropteroate synthase
METKLPLAPTRCGEVEFRWGERTYVMGVLNVTPDSFSGDGVGDDIKAALAQARRLADEGADIIDVGGESTRPGSAPVSADEEMRRVIPVIERLASEISVPISIDSYKSEVASEAIKAGASMINDVWGLKQDPDLARVAAEAGVPLVLVSHLQGSVPGDIIAAAISDLEISIKQATGVGVTEHNIIVDPGIGFGKSVAQNLELIRRLGELLSLGRPILLGTSRKFMVGLPFDQRLEATAATVAIAIAQGADMVRVHDVRQIARVCRMSDAIIRREQRGG